MIAKISHSDPNFLHAMDLIANVNFAIKFIASILYDKEQNHVFSIAASQERNL